jgi:predicted ATP-grasp superfamily ATP-dependent carboligase
MKTVLLTGARAPVTLDLARAFSDAGHRVIAAESMDYPLSIHSNAFNRFYSVTAPNLSLSRFCDDLVKIIELEKVDLLIPTCEEAFHVSKIKNVISEKTRVLVDHHEQLARLHSKYRFNEWVRNLGLDAPHSVCVNSLEEMQSAIRSLPGEMIVLKPEFSRFASKTLVIEKKQALADLKTIWTPVPWVVQECLVGKEFCSYSFALNGKLIAHVTYDHEFTAGKGAGICFESINHPAIEAWVEKFVSMTSFTGQIAFDFIEDSKGMVRPLECNPRATSGLHLIAHQSGFVDALLDKNLKENQQHSVIRPKLGMLGQLRLAMLVYGLPSIRSFGRWVKWIRIFFKAREVVYSSRDPLPFFDQFISFYRLIRQSRLQKITPLEVSTQDIEWNGEA